MRDPRVEKYRLVARVALLQGLCALLVASLFLGCKGTGAGLSALVGGLIVALGSAFFGWRMFTPGIAGAGRLAVAMYAAVALKWIWLVVALYLALGRLRLEPGPLLVGFAGAHAGFWAAALRSK